MSYTIYPDVLFVTNLVMDYFLLRLVKKLCRGKAGVWMTLAGAAFGAAGYCLLLLFPIGPRVDALLVYLIINTIMVRFGCGLRGPKEMGKGIAGLYIAGFLMGGMMKFLQRFVGIHRVSGVLLSGSVCYLAYTGILPFYQNRRRKVTVRYRVKLQTGEGETAVAALWDTGNRLYDPATGRPVSIIRKKTMEKLCARETMRELEAFRMGKPQEEAGEGFRRLRPHFLPFSSLGCSTGLLTVVTLDTMYLENEEIQKVIRHPMVAFSGEDSSAFGDCQMILHPDLIES